MTDLPLLEPSTGEPSNEEPSPNAAARRPRNRRILFGVLAGVVVLLVVVLGLSWHYLHQPSLSLNPPATLAGLTRDDSDNAKQTAEYLRAAVDAKMNLDENVGAVYRDSEGRNVFFFGGTRLLLNPAKDLDQALGLLNDTSGTVTGLHEVLAGPLGGVMKCGTSTGDGGPISVCGWADRGSLGVALFFGRTVDEAAQLLRDLRVGIERTS